MTVSKHKNQCSHALTTDIMLRDKYILVLCNLEIKICLFYAISMQFRTLNDGDDRISKSKQVNKS